MCVFRWRSNGNKGEGVITGEIESERVNKCEINIKERGSEKLKQFGAVQRRCMTRSSEVNQGQRAVERKEGNEHREVRLREV